MLASRHKFRICFSPISLPASPDLPSTTNANTVLLKLTTNKSEFHKNTERTAQLINYVMDKAIAELGPDSFQTHPERFYTSGAYRKTLTAISPGIR